MRGSQEQAVLTPALRDAIVAWLDAAAAAVEQWPLDPFDFSSIAAQLTESYRNARRHLPDDWTQASAEDLHALRQRVVDLRYQMELIEPLWPRFGRMWTEEAERLRDRLGQCQDLEVLKRLTGPHQPLAHWRSRLRRLAPNARRRSRSAPPASPTACSPSGPRRSATGSRRCGRTGAKSFGAFAVCRGVYS